uniref:Chemokine interleukin-8-like domain-containing protein n=1 Tax=Strigops habroptila TaxID=2489341 RepID=A0A672TIW7_STRHB
AVHHETLIIDCLCRLSIFPLPGSAGSQSMRKLSCVRLSTQQLSIRNLVSYEKQQVPVNAIMFITSKGIKICVSPDQKWVQTAIKKIDQKRAAKGK